MKRSIAILISSIVCISANAQTLVIKAEKAFTSSKQGVIENALIIIEKGKFKYVGKDNKKQLPKAAKILQAKVVTPGFIDSHSTVGVNGGYNVDADQDGFEKSDVQGSEYRVLDSFNPNEKLVGFSLSYGTTTTHITPTPIAPIAGTTALVKTYGTVADDMLVKNNVAMLFNLGDNPKQAFGNKNGPNTRMGTIAVVRKALYSAQNWLNKDKDKREPDIAMEQLAKVIKGKIKAVFSAHREQDIISAVRLAKEFKLNAIINYGTEAYLTLSTLQSDDVKVIVAPIMQRPMGLERQNASLEIASILDKAGVGYVFSSGYEAYVPKSRVLLFEMAIAVANGLAPDKAIAAATIVPAKLWSVDKTLGSIEKGKDADIVLFDGDPFEYTSHVTHVIVEGSIVKNNKT